MTTSPIHRPPPPALAAAFLRGRRSAYTKALRARGRSQDFLSGSSIGPGLIRRAGIHSQPVHDVCSHANWLGLLLVALLAARPDVALAGSPFATGANATQQQLVAILTPLAAVAVMVSGAMAWFGRLSWWWMVAVVIGTVLVFGGPQIVSWIRGLFGV
jgi:type IV secretion system protein VirB2